MRLRWLKRNKNVRSGASWIGRGQASTYILHYLRRCVCDLPHTNGGGMRKAGKYCILYILRRARESAEGCLGHTCERGREERAGTGKKIAR